MIALLPVVLFLAFFVVLGLVLYVGTTVGFWRRRWRERKAEGDPS